MMPAPRAVTAAVLVAVALLLAACQPAPPPPPRSSVTDAQLERLARCESGGRPTVVSASGRYHGLFQFDQRTWNGVARSTGRLDLVGVRPSRASVADQHAMARALHAQRGWKPWPVCGRKARSA